MSEKPWDKLRVAPPTTPDPIGTGQWITGDGARVEVTGVRNISVDLTISGWAFGVDGLRELAEFCNELADQLENQ